MKSAFSHILIKFLKISGITVAVLLLLLFLLPYLFPDFISAKIRQWAKGSIRTELNFSSARLSFFRHFPALTLTLYDFKVKGSAPFGNETLVEADEIALGVDISSVFSQIKIDKIFLTNAFINIQVDTAGNANYDIYNSPKKNGPSSPADSANASLKIQKILIEKSKLVYNDRSLPMLINARDLYYKGNGDLSKAIFDLNSHTEVGSMDFYYGHQAYFLSKKINADLVTRINTNSLALLFDKNDLTINDLPVEFTGRFEFLKNGYDMDFKLRSKDSYLRDMITALPQGVLDWLSRTEVKGVGDIDATLKGKYIASTGEMPDLGLVMKIRDGSVASAQAPSPVNHLFLDFRCTMPGLNLDSLSVVADSLFFNIDKDYFSAILKWKGLTAPLIYARVHSAIDLEKWDKAIGLPSADLKGRYELHLEVDGKYATRIIRTKGLRNIRADTIVASIPHFSIRSSLKNGYFKYVSSPEAVRNISFDMDASCSDNDYRHARFSLENINATVLGSYIKGFFRSGIRGDAGSGGSGNATDISVDGSLETVFHLSDIKKVYPLDSMELGGDLQARLQAKGNYRRSKKLFPVMVASLQLDNGILKTKYYPHPLEKIQVSARISSSKGSIKDLEVNLTPVSFLFEGQPFTVRADLENFEDLKYNIVSKGVLDLGKIYRVFALPGYQVNGFVESNLSLRGKQSDAMAGRYGLLFNSGTLKVKDLQVSSELFPLPFLISNGVFRFDQDKMWFDAFHGSYGKSDLALNGYLSNVINYALNKNAPLKGNLDLSSDLIAADEFMVFGGGGRPPVSPGASEAGRAGDAVASPGAVAQTGVIIVPADLSVNISASVKKVQYNGMDIKDFKGQLTIDSGELKLNKTSFALIGAPVEMDAAYKSLSPQKAQFDYHIDAKEFDVKRAYKEIKLFHDLASSASKAEGIISLNYHLAGKLDGNMRPVYPSLKGGGVLSVSKVKMKGLKLFGAVSKESGKDVNDPDLSKVEVKSTINNNLITIERTRMKVSVFKLRMEGQASFDGRLNLRFRVGLPPFGVIGIPLTITGTQDNPKVSAGRGDKKDQLQETEDKDEEGKDN